MPWSKITQRQREVILSRLGISLTADQQPVLASTARTRLVAGGERGGKSFTAAVDLTTRVPFGHLFWLVGPDYQQSRAEFEYILEFLARLGAINNLKADVSMPKEGSWTLKTKTGQVVETKTSSDVRKLASKSVSGIVITEAGQCTYDTYFKCIGRVSQERGFVLLEGTLEEAGDWYATLLEEWMADSHAARLDDAQAFRLPTWSNTAQFPGGRMDPEILHLEQVYSRVPGLFDMRCGAIAAPPVGVIFRQFSYLRHVTPEVQFNPRAPVYLAIDPSLGGASAYAIVACQFRPDPAFEALSPLERKRMDALDFCDVIDAIYVPGALLEDLLTIIRSREWWPNVKGGAIDVAEPAEKRRWASMLGVGLWSQKVPIVQGERRLASFLHYDLSPEDPDQWLLPHIRYAPNVPEECLQEYRQYRNPLVAEDLQTRSPQAAAARVGPEHHLKALWYLLVSRYGYVRGGRLDKPFVRGGLRRMLYGNRP